MEGVWLAWQAGTRKAVNKPNSVTGRNGVTKRWRVSCLVLSGHRSRDHNRYYMKKVGWGEGGGGAKSLLARIDKRTARATGNTRYRYNQNGPLHHKMADSCVSALARTNTVSSTITTPIKTSKTSNESYSYNLLHCINKMYIHYFFFFFFFYNKSGKRGLRLSINRFVQLNHN